MDIELAGKMNGITAAGQIRSFSDVPLIYLTSYSQDPLLQQAKITGPYGYLVKPVPERELVAAIEITLYRHVLDMKLKESEERYRTVIEHSRDGIALMKGDAHIFVNQRFAEIFGYDSPEEITGKSHKITVHPDDLERVTDINRKRQTADTAAPSTYEFKGIRKAGGIVYIEVSAGMIMYGGEPHTLVYLRDVTEHKKLEDQFRQSQKLEAIGQLAGGVAHDFNNILTVIIGFASVLQMDVAPDDPSRGHIEQILVAADKAANLTQSLLTFSRKQIISLKPLNINVTIRKIKKMLARLIGEDIEFKMHLTQKDLIVMADSGQIDQVFMNIVTNARDAMPYGGRLTISARMFTIDDDFVKRNGFGEPGEYTLISITDTGAGMDRETAGRIFDPFFTTKEVGKGTGLGLSTVYGIIKQHNGLIMVESEPGKGTTFNMYLPLIKLEVITDASANMAEAAPGGRETIMVVEDEEGVRKFIRVILERFGYTVLEAQDGEEALIRFAALEDAIDLSLIDLVMPGMNGIEVYGEMTKIKPDARAIFMSGYTEDILQQKDLLGEGFRFISKPVTPDELLKGIREALDS
jgi:PAS domain S-box-containing protein